MSALTCVTDRPPAANQCRSDRSDMLKYAQRVHRLHGLNASDHYCRDTGYGAAECTSYSLLCKSELFLVKFYAARNSVRRFWLKIVS